MTNLNRRTFFDSLRTAFAPLGDKRFAPIRCDRYLGR
jgi:hypothetical protein